MKIVYINADLVIKRNAMKMWKMSNSSYEPRSVRMAKIFRS